ncbi:MAG: NADH-quinone oxidoreductase subunit M [Gemmatimonadetes bacterium]|nr:NADH-quinone oxidoreductase subunit M [Gemmatimonadota bacterium]MYB98419.1 NADH-quinone oxidoreductase subunit M [Gemmatimonadota bacterium]MYI45086.1 NADH-quinone oxidoreductase subunit M [Gemmatimonadota bacterium]
MTDLLASILYEDWILHALIWMPLVGTVHVLLTSADRAKDIAFRWSALVFVLSLGLWWSFDPGDGGFTMVSTAPWIESWGVSYSLGIDGISVFMVLLTTFTSAIAILGSFEYVKTRRKAFYALMLLLEMGVVGFFLATDIFLFYVFFELTLVPMYFIVGIWGGQRRIYAAIKFFLYTAVGSLLMLVAILYVYFSSGTGSFGYDAFMNAGLSLREQLWLFAAFALAFGIKVPVFPLHTWLPDAHVEAPTPGSVILASVLLKMGTYGFLRFLLPFFPEASRHPTVVMVMLVLGVMGIIYAAWVAAVQPDGKKLVAYTSVAHMGFVVIGVFALTLNGLQGGMVVMISHGISTGALFLLLGMMYERRHTRLIEDYGGIGRVAPWFATAFVITALASIGLPGTSGFVGEFLALLGAFETHMVVAAIAALGVIFAAYYMLPMVQRILFNKLDKPENRTFADLSRREMAIMAPLVALMIWIGVHPTPFLERMEPSIEVVLERVEGAPRAEAGTTEAPTLIDARAVLVDAPDPVMSIPGDAPPGEEN